jgi:hydrogenase maturation protease
MTAPRVLVAGIGNIFMGDDGFGCEVVRRLSTGVVPDGVKVRDFGIRGLDLAFELLEPWDEAILVDAMARGGAPGTLYVLEPAQPSGVESEATPLEAHAMTPDVVLRNRAALGGGPLRVRVVGCEPGALPGDDDLCGDLSAPVAAAVEPAVALVRELLNTPELRTKGATVHA